MNPADLTFVPLFDRPRAVSLVARWWFDEWGHLEAGSSFADAVATLARQLDPARLPIQMLAEHRGEVLGAGVLRLHEMEDVLPRVENWLGSLYVAERARGQGVASALVDRLERLALSRRIGELHVGTRRLDGGLYAKLGWQREQMFRYREREMLVMKKRLWTVHSKAG